MLPISCIMMYRRRFPDDICMYNAPDGLVMITSSGANYIQPADESEDTFKDRIQRCAKVDRNLFVEEWQRMRTGVIY